MASVSSPMERVTAVRGEIRAKLASIPDERMTSRVSWQGHNTEVRSLLYRIADGGFERRQALRATVDALGWRQTEAQRILALASETRGQLGATLLGVPDEAIDERPPGEWSIRMVLEHHIVTERRYRIATEYAVERLRKGGDLPVQVPAERLPAQFGGEPTTTGGLDQLMAELHEARIEIVHGLSDVAPEELTGPTIWAGRDVDVRLRLSRFAAHEREHTVHINKILRVIGHRPTEAHLILGQADIAHGQIVGMVLGLPPDALQRNPGGGQPSVAQILENGVVEERALTEAIASVLR